MDSTFRFSGNVGPNSKISMLWDSLNVTKCHEMSRKLSQTRNQITRLRARNFVSPAQILSFESPATTLTVQIVPENSYGRKILIFAKMSRNVTKSPILTVWIFGARQDACTPPRRLCSSNTIYRAWEYLHVGYLT